MNESMTIVQSIRELSADETELVNGGMSLTEASVSTGIIGGTALGGASLIADKK